MPTYAQKSSAIRAAKRSGFPFEIFQAEDGRWGFHFQEEVVPTSDRPEQLIDGHVPESGYDLEEDLKKHYGHSHCPNCGIILENGVGYGEELDFTCMACNQEFGPQIRLRRSKVKRPCTMVWDIAEAMMPARRKDIVNACVEAGIAYGTARTQTQHFLKSYRKTQNQSA